MFYPSGIQFQDKFAGLIRFVTMDDPAFDTPEKRGEMIGAGSGLCERALLYLLSR